MKMYLIGAGVTMSIIALAGALYLSRTQPAMVATIVTDLPHPPLPTIEIESPPSVISLSVPYLSQAPDGNWDDPWGNACEEASAVMLDAYYRHVDEAEVDIVMGKKMMQTMFQWENETWKKNEDTDAEETRILFNEHTQFSATVQRHPTLEDIKKELRDGHPVLAHVNQFQLYKEPVRKNESYHVVIITGYDDTKQEFTVNDPARPKKEYSYEALMHALHDYNETTDEADLDPVVLFTKEK